MKTVLQIRKELSEKEHFPVLVIGTNGISKEVASILYEINDFYGKNTYDFLGYVGETSSDVGKDIGGDECVCTDDTLFSFISDYESIGLVIPLGTPSIKRKIYDRVSDNKRIIFPNIVSPSAKIMMPDRVRLGQGNIICSGVVMTTDIEMGNFNLFNLNTTVGHDSHFGDYCVVNPLCAIAGFADIRDDVLLGAGSSIKEHVLIANNSIIGMGAIIAKDVEGGAVMICDGAHRLR